MNEAIRHGDSRHCCSQLRICFISVTIVFSLTASLVVAQRDPPATPPAEPPTTQPSQSGDVEIVAIAETEFRLELALDDESREKGLSGREQDDLEEDEGMLFVFPDERMRWFWMYECTFDLDLIFLNEDGRIVELHEMKAEKPRQPREPEAWYNARLKRYDSRRAAQFAIELHAGFIDKLKLKRGEVIELDLERLKSLAE